MAEQEVNDSKRRGEKRREEDRRRKEKRLKAIRDKKQKRTKAGISTNIMVDCSHANSNKDPGLQPLVMENVTNQILEGNKSIIGLMVESHINWGAQKIPADLSQLQYGVSVTDACIDWPATEKAVLDMANKLRGTLPKRNG